MLRMYQVLFDRNTADRETGGRVLHAVKIPGMRERTNHGHAVHHPGHVRQMFADVAARKRRRDWPELAAHLDRGVRFHVAHFEMAGTSKEVQQDDVLRRTK